MSAWSHPSLSTTNASTVFTLAVSAALVSVRSGGVNSG
jgi:hypothetical protein